MYTAPAGWRSSFHYAGKYTARFPAVWLWGETCTPVYVNLYMYLAWIHIYSCIYWLHQPVGVAHFTTLENTPPDFLLCGAGARQVWLVCQIFIQIAIYICSFIYTAPTGRRGPFHNAGKHATGFPPLWSGGEAGAANSSLEYICNVHIFEVYMHTIYIGIYLFMYNASAGRCRRLYNAGKYATRFSAL